ncbi:MAG: carotenoid oxygenase family protein [Acidimicrobiales bacterium]
MPIPRSILARDGFPDLDLVLDSGTWPDDLAGEIVITTSDQRTAPQHAFFGDGVVLRLSLRPGTHGAASGTFAWRTAVIDSPSQRLRAARPELFEATVLGARSPFGFSNAANTAPLPWGDRLFATWDAGRPVEIDAASLSFVAEVGHRDDWAPAIDAPVLPLITSTAHPVIDPDRDCMWTVSLDPIAGQVQLVRYDGEGSRVQRWPVRDGAVPQSMHTITQTRDWLILADCAFRADPNEIFGLGERSVTNNPDEPVYLIRKDAVEATRVGEPVAAAAFRVAPEVMHYYARYDDAEGIEVVFEHTPDTDLAMYLRADDTDAFGRPVDPAMAGMYNHPMHATVVSLLRFDPESGRVTERAIMSDPERYHSTQLSAIDWSTEGLSSPAVHHLLCSGFRPEAISQRAVELYRDRLEPFPPDEMPSVLVTLDRESLQPLGDWEWPLDEYPTSPTFVPRDAASSPGSRYAGADPGGHDGYLVVPVLSDSGFTVQVFDAADVAAGPVASLRTPGHETVPFLLHAAWMPRARPAPRLDRLRFADELTSDRLAQLPEDLAAVARGVATDMLA